MNNTLSEEQIAQLKRTHDAMVDKRDQLEEGLAELKVSLETKQKAIEDLTREVGALRSGNDALKSELEEWRTGASGTLSDKVQLSI
jgi:predicted  nucleic acid-binding Zn-ribbon protein